MLLWRGRGRPQVLVGLADKRTMLVERRLSKMVTCLVAGSTPHHSIEDSRDLIRRQQQWYAQCEGIRWGVTMTGAEDRVIGSCGFFLFDEEFRRAEMGYELARRYWRQGIMREALGAIITYAFANTALHRIEAVVNGANDPSKALLRALGFTLEGALRQRCFFADRYWDDVYFGLLKDEWRV